MKTINLRLIGILSIESSKFSTDHIQINSRMEAIVFPVFVSEYSTFGGIRS